MSDIDGYTVFNKPNKKINKEVIERLNALQEKIIDHLMIKDLQKRVKELEKKMNFIENYIDSRSEAGSEVL